MSTIPCWCRKFNKGLELSLHDILTNPHLNSGRFNWYIKNSSSKYSIIVFNEVYFKRRLFTFIPYQEDIHLIKFCQGKLDWEMDLCSNLNSFSNDEDHLTQKKLNSHVSKLNQSKPFYFETLLQNSYI